MRAFSCRLAAHTGLVPTGDEVVFVDIDSKVKPVYGPAKQGASFGWLIPPNGTGALFVPAAVELALQWAVGRLSAQARQTITRDAAGP